MARVLPGTATIATRTRTWPLAGGKQAHACSNAELYVIICFCCGNLAAGSNVSTFAVGFFGWVSVCVSVDPGNAGQVGQLQ